MVALNYARDVRIGDRPARAVALGSNFVWPTLPERLFLRGQSMVYDFVGQKYAARLPDNTIDYTTSINDLGILTRASTATYWGPSGTLLEAAVDEARIQHDPVTGEALGLLIEGGRTNHVPQSTDMSLWDQRNVETTLDGPPLVNGLASSKVSLIEPGLRSGVRVTGLTNTEARYCTGVFLKAGSATHAIISTTGSANYTRHAAGVDLVTGEFYSTFSDDSRVSSESIQVTPAGNGWFHVSLVSTITAISRSISISPSNGQSVTVGGIGGNIFGLPQGVTTEGMEAGDYVYVAGVQLETGSSPTSYIPTIDSPVTRAADVVSIDLSDVFNPDEGTLRITAQVPEGGVVASLGDMQVVSDSDEFKEYDLNYLFHSGNTVAQLGEGIFNKVEYFPAMQGESVLGDLIRTLYGNGEQGVMYIPEPKVLGQQVLWQDVEGTVPVMSDGDPVGLMLDVSGNGNHATQSVSAARPIYRTDGELHWLEFDGVDDFLLIQDLQRTGVSSFYNSVAVSRTGGSGFRAMLSLGGTGPDELLHYFSGTRDRIYIDAGEVDSTSTGGAVYGDGERAVSTIFNDGGSWRLWKNLVQNFSELGAVQLSQTDEMWAVGASASGGDRFLQGNIYGQVTRIGESTTDDANQAVTYLANLAGVTL